MQPLKLWLKKLIPIMVFLPLQYKHLRADGYAMLVDNNGKKIATIKLHQGENDIQNSGIAVGNYFVILDIDGQQETRKIIIK